MSKKVRIIMDKDAFGNVKRSQVIIPNKANIAVQEVSIQTNWNGTKDVELKFSLPHEQLLWEFNQDVLPRDEVYSIMGGFDEDKQKKILEYARMVEGAV